MAVTLFHPLLSSIMFNDLLDVSSDWFARNKIAHITCNWVKVWNWFAQRDFSKQRTNNKWIRFSRMRMWRRRVSMCIWYGCFPLTVKLIVSVKLNFSMDQFQSIFKWKRSVRFFLFHLFIVLLTVIWSFKWKCFKTTLFFCSFTNNSFEKWWLFWCVLELVFSVHAFAVRAEMIFRSTRLTRYESNLDRTFNWPLLD